MKNLLFLMLLVCSQGSCQNVSKSNRQITNSTDAKAFFNATENYYLESKNALQNLVDKLKDAILLVHSDKNAKVDTKELRILLDSAKRSISIRIAKLNKLKEVDEEIGLKKKELAYLALFDSAYNNQIKEGIEIFDSKSKNRDVDAANKMKPVFLKIKEAELVFKKANQDFIDKYKID
jgi:hypothetical protein